MPVERWTSKAQKLANSRLSPHIGEVSFHTGRLSPLGSASFGAPVTRILAAGQALPSPSGDGYHYIHKRDIAAIQDAMHAALHPGDATGGDELLYGRAGLLHTLLNLRELQLDDETMQVLRASVFKKIPLLVDSMISSGKLAAREYLELYGEQEYMPLMWPWHDKYYIGAWNTQRLTCL
ncbi:predicted protein [Uncinocarpus reesii 1704]|uniref:Uncharacterized protein n=1 Tax=Uncinocarpus reesii (strain UAMH 1704) TaxID=336963 RepID=C4JTZ5_UNCRE|nr:uncharacterized protein UREG_05934 [Uncinocarpus reesii 1704]EEP81092.1 predicted protein [Uncinocarpus reesii 1704]